MARQLNVILVDTAPNGSKGSMARYAILVEKALSADPGVHINRASLAFSEHTLLRLPKVLRNWLHHLKVYLGTTRLRSTDAHVFHVLDGSHGYVISLFPEYTRVVTAHDVVPALQLQGVLAGPVLGHGARWLVRRSLSSLKMADHVIADSANTGKDVRKICSVEANKISVVPPALDPNWKTCGEKVKETQSQGFGNDYILHVGNDGFYKNREGVVRIFAKIREKFPVRLILAGSAPNHSLHEIAKKCGVDQYVESVVAPSDDELCRLYANARLLLFPSVYEGFGWPPLEAMASGCPVVCSTAGSLDEITGDAVLKADALDEARLAEHCTALLDNNSLAEKMAALGRTHVEQFTLDKMRTGLIDVYRKVAGIA